MKIELGKVKNMFLKFISKFISKNSDIIYLILLNETGLTKEEAEEIESASKSIKKALKNLKNRK